MHPLPEDDVALPLPDRGNGRWHEAFCLAARECLRGLSDGELLILGLRLRYRRSQREVAQLLGVHEGTISRQTDKLRDRCLEQISHRLVAQGWTGDDLTEYILTEMGPLLLDEPRLWRLGPSNPRPRQLAMPFLLRDLSFRLMLLALVASLSMVSAAHHFVASQLTPAGQGAQPGG